MKNFFKKEKSFKKEQDSLWSHINLYWKLAVFFMFVATIFSFFFGYSLFKKINKEPAIDASGASGQVEAAKKEEIKKVLEYFSKREEKSSEIINSPSPITDPSI